MAEGGSGRRTSVALALVALLVWWATGCGGDDDDGGAASSTEVTTAPDEEAAPPFVIGHRGASGHFPDNTLEAIEGGAELGAEWVEIDARLSSDGVAVLSHDPVTEDGLVITATSADELAEADVPTLAEALALAEEVGVGVNLEIKAEPTEEDFDPSLAVVDASVEDVQASGFSGDLVVSSFNRDAIDRVRDLSEDELDTFLIAAGLGDPDTLADDLALVSHEGLALEGPQTTAELVETFTDQGIEVWSWTINEPAEAQALVDRGVTGIITDFPDRIAEQIN